MAQRFGIQFRAPSDADLAKNSAADWGAFTLGVAATTPLDLANAYATLGADGLYCKPLPVDSITGPDGAKVDGIGPSCNQVVSPDVARAATDAARCPVGDQSSFGTCDGGTATQVSDILAGRQVAGKTGSSESNATETFVGFTPQIAVAAIAANPDDPGDHVGSAVQTHVVDAVARTMLAGLNGKPNADFTAPSASIAYGNDGPTQPPTGAANPGDPNATANGILPGNPTRPGTRAAATAPDPAPPRRLDHAPFGGAAARRRRARSSGAGCSAVRDPRALARGRAHRRTAGYAPRSPARPTASPASTPSASRVPVLVGADRVRRSSRSGTPA